MPSLTDIANQVNNTLSQIQTNTSSSDTTLALVKGDTADLKIRADTLIATNQAGFSNVSAGIQSMISRQDQTNAALDFHRQQFDTIICWLTSITDLLCRQLRRLNSILDVDENSLLALEILRDISQLVHGHEAVEVEKLGAIRSRLEVCCPPREPDPEPCGEPCASPKHSPSSTDIPAAIPFKPLRAEDLANLTAQAPQSKPKTTAAKRPRRSRIATSTKGKK